LDALALKLAAQLDLPWSEARAALGAKIQEVDARYRALGDWEAVVAALAAEHGVTVAELRARAARWEAGGRDS